MADVLNNNTFLDKFRDTCFICVKHLPKTHKRQTVQRKQQGKFGIVWIFFEII